MEGISVEQAVEQILQHTPVINETEETELNKAGGRVLAQLELEDPEEYIRNKFKGKEVSYEKTVLEDGTIIFDITTSQIKQRCSFTEI